MKAKFLPPTRTKRDIVNSVAQIIMRVCGVSQKEAYLMAKEACIFNVARRYAGGKTTHREIR